MSPVNVGTDNEAKWVGASVGTKVPLVELVPTSSIPITSFEDFVLEDSNWLPHAVGSDVLGEDFELLTLHQWEDVGIRVEL